MTRLWHGPEFDEAQKRSKAPDQMGVCMTALESRKASIVEDQLRDWGPGGEYFEETKKNMMRAGLPFDDNSVLAVCLNSALGATFTFGLAIGIELAAIDKSTEDDHRG